MAYRRHSPPLYGVLGNYCHQGRHTCLKQTISLKVRQEGLCWPNKGRDPCQKEQIYVAGLLGLQGADLHKHHPKKVFLPMPPTQGKVFEGFQEEKDPAC